MGRSRNEYDGPLIQMLRDQWQRELNKIERAEMEIIVIKNHLLELGEELPRERLINALEKVIDDLRAIQSLLENQGSPDKEDAMFYYPGLVEASNLIYYLQDEARRRIARPQNESSIDKLI